MELELKWKEALLKICKQKIYRTSSRGKEGTLVSCKRFTLWNVKPTTQTRQSHGFVQWKYRFQSPRICHDLPTLHASRRVPKLSSLWIAQVACINTPILRRSPRPGTKKAVGLQGLKMSSSVPVYVSYDITSKQSQIEMLTIRTAKRGYMAMEPLDTASTPAVHKNLLVSKLYNPYFFTCLYGFWLPLPAPCWPCASSPSPPLPGMHQFWPSFRQKLRHRQMSITRR